MDLKVARALVDIDKIKQAVNKGKERFAFSLISNEIEEMKQEDPNTYDQNYIPPSVSSSSSQSSDS